MICFLKYCLDLFSDFENIVSINKMISDDNN